MRKVGHIRQRTPGSWELRYSLGTNPLTGQRRTATATVVGTRKDAEKELRRLLRTIDDGSHVDPSRMTVEHWLERWLAEVSAEVSPKTYERYSQIVANFLVPELGNVALSKLTAADIGTAYVKWQNGGRRDGKSGGPSPRTRRHVHRILRSALARAVEQHRIAQNPADAFRNRLPKVERREMQTLSVEHSAKLLDSLQQKRLYWVCLMALATGMRRGEILALRWKNADLERGVVHVVESIEQTKALGLRFKPTKNNKGRAITLPKFATDELRRLRTKQAKELLGIGIRQTGETLVFARADGTPVKPMAVTHEFAKAIRRLGDLPNIRFHDLRHSHATQLLLAGVHPKVCQERLGHATIATTLDLYSHVTGTMQQDAAERLNSELGNAISRNAPK
jgi:integrase